MTENKGREEMHNVVRPLRREGIDKVKFQDVRVPDLTEQDEVIDDRTREQVFSIASLSFKEENKWRLSDGTNVFLIDMEDRGFLSNINNNEEVFAKGDQLKIRLRVVQYRKPNGDLRTDHKAVEVLNHQLAGVKRRQIPLPADEETQ